MYTCKSGPRENRWALHEDSVGIPGAQAILDTLNMTRRNHKLLENVLQEFPQAWTVRVKRTFRGYPRVHSKHYEVVQFSEAVVEQEWSKALPVLSKAGDRFALHAQSQSALACALQLGETGMIGQLLELGASTQSHPGTPILMHLFHSAPGNDPLFVEKLHQGFGGEFNAWAACTLPPKKPICLFEHQLKAGLFALAHGLLEHAPREMPAHWQKKPAQAWKVYTKAFAGLMDTRYLMDWHRNASFMAGIAEGLSARVAVPHDLVQQVHGFFQAQVKDDEVMEGRNNLNIWARFYQVFGTLPGVGEDTLPCVEARLMKHAHLLDGEMRAWWGARALDGGTRGTSKAGQSGAARRL